MNIAVFPLPFNAREGLQFNHWNTRQGFDWTGDFTDSAACTEVQPLSQDLLDEVLGKPRSDRQQALDAAYHEAREANWDGFGALAISPAAYRDARTFLSQLPAYVDTPEVDPDPDGALSIHWDFDRRWVFAVSLAGDGHVHYAGLFGPASVHGKEVFRGEIPEPVVKAIHRVIGPKKALQQD